MIPPLWLTVRVRRMTLWFPLFLIWLLLLVLLSPIIVILLLAALVLVWFREGREWLRFAAQIWAIICSAHGLNVEVVDRFDTVYIHIV